MSLNYSDKLNKVKSQKSNFFLDTGREILEKISLNDDSSPEKQYFDKLESPEKRQLHLRSKSKQFDVEDVKEETRKLFIKLQEKTYTENAEYKNEINKNLKDISSNLNLLQVDYSQLKNEIQKLEIRKKSDNTDNNDKVSKLESELISLKVKNMALEKKMVEYIDKNDRIIDSNLSLTGLVGEYNKFKDLKSLLEYLLTNTQNANSIRDKMTIENQTFKEKLERSVSTMANRMELQERSIKSQIYNKIDMTENNFRNLLDNMTERIEEVKLENSKAAVKLIHHSEILEKDIDDSIKVRKDLIETFQNTEGNIKSSFEEFKKETYEKISSNKELIISEKCFLLKQISDNDNKLNKFIDHLSQLNSKIGSLEDENNTLKNQIYSLHEKVAHNSPNQNQKANHNKENKSLNPNFYSSLSLAPDNFQISLNDETTKIRKNSNISEKEEENVLTEQSTNNKKPEKNKSNLKAKSSHKIMVVNNSNINTNTNYQSENFSPNKLESYSKSNSYKALQQLISSSFEDKEKIELLVTIVKGLAENYNDFKTRATINSQRTELSIQDLRKNFNNLYYTLTEINRKEQINEYNQLANSAQLKPVRVLNKNAKSFHHIEIPQRNSFRNSKANTPFINYSNIKLPQIEGHNTDRMITDTLTTNPKESTSKSLIKTHNGRFFNFDAIMQDMILPEKQATNNQVKKKYIINKKKDKTEKELENTILSKIKSELDNDKDQIDNHLSVQVLDPSCITQYNSMKNKLVSKSNIKPKDLTNYMKFNLVESKK